MGDDASDTIRLARSRCSSDEAPETTGEYEGSVPATPNQLYSGSTEATTTKLLLLNMLKSSVKAACRSLPSCTNCIGLRTERLCDGP